MWYGVSSIAARFINYLLTPYLTYSTLISKANYGQMSAIYAAIPLFNVIFTYGMETTYFRFMRKDVDREAVNNTASISFIISSIVLSILLWMNQAGLQKLQHSANFLCLFN